MLTINYSESAEILKPLLFFLRVLGLNRDLPKLPKRAWLVLIITHLYFVHNVVYLAVNFASYGRHKNENIVTLNISEVAYCFACIFSLDYFISRRKTIYALLEAISPDDGRGGGARREKIVCRFAVTFACSLCVYRFAISQHWTYKYMDKAGDYLKIYMYGVHNYLNNMWWIRGISFVEKVGYISTSFTFLIVLLFKVMMARLLTLKIASFARSVSVDDLSRVGQRHGDVFDLTRRTEALIDVPYRIWAFQWMVASILHTPKTVEMYAKAENLFLAFHYGFQAAVNLVAFGCVSLAFAHVDDFQARVVSAVHRRMVRPTALDLIGGPNDLIREATYRLLMARVSSGQLQIKLCKSVVLSKRFILNFYSLMVTIIISVTQELL